MKVRELMEMLQDHDPESEVRIMSQESWPFENAIHTVIARNDFGPGTEDEEVDVPAGGHHDDVFIVEGRQLCYGSKDAWGR